jgi:hypothetical protein
MEFSPAVDKGPGKGVAVATGQDQAGALATVPGAEL